MPSTSRPAREKREKKDMNKSVKIEASTVGNGVGNVDGHIAFHPRKMLNRPGLLLIDGVLYLAFSSISMASRPSIITGG